MNMIGCAFMTIAAIGCLLVWAAHADPIARTAHDVANRMENIEK